MSNKIILLLFLGFLFRLFLAFNAYNTIVFDAKGYSDFAIQFLQGKWVIDCCAKKIWGTVHFSRLFISFSGIENLTAVRLVHIVIDLMSRRAFISGRQKIFNQEAAALFSFNLSL